MGFCKQIRFHNARHEVVDFSEESLKAVSSKREVLYLNITFQYHLIRYRIEARVQMEGSLACLKLVA